MLLMAGRTSRWGMEIGRLPGDPGEEARDSVVRRQRVTVTANSRQLGIGEVRVDRPVADRVDGDSLPTLARFRHGMMALHPLAERTFAQPAGRSARFAQPAFSAFFFFIASWNRSAQPGFTICSARTMRSSPGATSRLTVLPAATMASAPMVTGATSALLEPMKARSPITVRCLK